MSKKNEYMVVTDTSQPELKQSIYPTLVDMYRDAFARPPWYERSRCQNEQIYLPDDPGTACQSCGTVLEEAYRADELMNNWDEALVNGGVLIVKQSGDKASFATIARPTNPGELWRRKYANNDEMEMFLVDNLPKEVVWIEDSFADLRVSQRGNMSERREVLSQIRAVCGIAAIATRTLAAPVIASTVRDMSTQTDIYSGTEEVMLSANYKELVRSRTVGTVPDTRTFLLIDMENKR